MSDGWAEGSDAGSDFSDGFDASLSLESHSVSGDRSAESTRKAAAEPGSLECAVRSRDELERGMKSLVEETAGLLDVSSSAAVALLMHFAWKKERLVDAYFADDGKVMRDAGLLPNGKVVQEVQETPQVVGTSQPGKRKKSEVGEPPKKKAASRRSRRLNATDSEDVEDSPEQPASQPSSAEPLPNGVSIAPSSFECTICYASDGAVPSVRLACGHRFCVDCVQHQIKSSIVDAALISKLCCLEVSCNVLLPDDVVRALAGPTTSERYDSLLFDSFIFSDPHLRYCPNPLCPHILSVSTLPHAHETNRHLPPTATCLCGTSLCFTCGFEGSHSPALCALNRHWSIKSAQETATGNYLLSHTKECIRCGTAIEKNGGCNHMACTKCGMHFCWQCACDWNASGGYNHRCNSFSSSSAEKSASDARRELKRYLHHFDRFNNHAQSAKLGDEFMKKVCTFHAMLRFNLTTRSVQIEKKMLEMQGVVEKPFDDPDPPDVPPEPAMEGIPDAAHFSWIASQFLSCAGVTALRCRKTLQYTYVHAYYLLRDTPAQLSTLQLFEDIQADLESAVEKLSDILENTRWIELEKEEAEKRRMEAQDLQRYCESRRRVVLEDVERGLDGGCARESVRAQSECGCLLADPRYPCRAEGVYEWTIKI